MKNHRIFQAYFIGPTDDLPPRLVIKDLRNRKKITVNKKYDDTYDLNSCELAEIVLKEKGIDIIGFGQAERGFMLFTENFETQIKN